MQSGEQFVSVSSVQNNRCSGDLQRVPVRFIPLHQESHDPGCMAVCRDGLRRYDAETCGQTHIDESEVWMETLRSAECFLTTASFCNNFYLLLPLQQTAQAFAGQDMLTYEQDTEPPRLSASLVVLLERPNHSASSVRYSVARSTHSSSHTSTDASFLATLLLHARLLQPQYC